jgi:hypothetical protein
MVEALALAGAIALAKKLGGWAIAQLGEYAADEIKPSIKEALGMKADEDLLKKIDGELRSVLNVQEQIKERVSAFFFYVRSLV